MVSTALAAGFDIVAGLVALSILDASLQGKLGLKPAHVLASLGFGIGFVFLIVGRSELFTENFLVRSPGSTTGAAAPGWVSQSLDHFAPVQHPRRGRDDPGPLDARRATEWDGADPGEERRRDP
jgi:hypothetical protein